MDTDDQKERRLTHLKSNLEKQYNRYTSISTKDLLVFFYLNNLNTTLLTLLLWEYRNHSTDWLNIFLEYEAFFIMLMYFLRNCDE